MSYYNLFLDDARQPHQVGWVDLPQVTWTIVKNYNEFVKIIQKNGLPNIITFDHDLGEEHYAEYHWAHSEKNIASKGIFRYDHMKEKTGYDCAKWLVEYCMSKELDLPVYYVHTMNPIGAKNIISLFASYKKSQNID